MGVGVGWGVGSGVGLGVGSGVGWGVGSGVGVGVASVVGVGVGVSLGVAVGGGGEQGIAAASEPEGDGISNDGITPLSSGVGSGKQVGDGLGEPHPSLATNTPQVRPYGLNSPL